MRLLAYDATSTPQSLVTKAPVVGASDSPEARIARNRTASVRLIWWADTHKMSIVR